ncbi:MAG: NUDIX domain-containing protein [Candidatus Nealsonbacteria bacterium]|nr:NUDIX domain-containing protein [Candidatus Nealsonbacteria bacterium]
MKLTGLLKSKTRRKTLKLFFSNKDKRYYLRELERALSLPVGNIRRELIALEDLGLFRREKEGRKVYYSLNKESPILAPVEEMVSEILGNKKRKIPTVNGKKGEAVEFDVAKKDIEILFLKVKEVENILDRLLHKKSRIEDFINLGVVRNKKGEILIIRRAEEERGKGEVVLTWAFPGGTQRLNETREECVVREVLAETGYKVKPIKEISARLHPQFPVFIVYHLCSLTSDGSMKGTIEPHEVSEIKWVKPKEIKFFFTTDFESKVKKELGLE